MAPDSPEPATGGGPGHVRTQSAERVRTLAAGRPWRGLATRYGKSPDSYEAGLHLLGSNMWLKLLTTTT